MPYSCGSEIHPHDPPGRFFRVRPAIERRDAEKALAGTAESAPGVMTIFASSSIMSNIAQLLIPGGVPTQMYGALVPPKTSSPIFAQASRRIRALPM